MSVLPVFFAAMFLLNITPGPDMLYGLVSALGVDAGGGIAEAAPGCVGHAGIGVAAVYAFMILTDASLADLCARKPSTFEELTEVSGIGERRAQSVGKEMLTALRDFAAH